MSRPLKVLLALSSAVLYALAFPNYNLSSLAWISLVPLIHVTAHEEPKRAFWLGWITGTLAYAGILSWIVTTFLAAHQSMFLAVVCLLLLAAYIGLFWGAWAAFLSMTQQQRGLTPLSAAAAWVAFEFLRTHLFSGFPWALLGDSQWQHLLIIQIASLTGVYGVSFLIILVNATIVGALEDYAGVRTRVQRLITIALCGISFLYGLKHLRSYATETPTAINKVALLQGSIDQYQKWDKQYVDSIERTFERLNVEASHDKPDLIVWPETSVPGFLLQDPPLRAWLNGVVRRTGTFHLVGAPSSAGENSAYNSAVSLNPKAEILGQYDKQHLVPFGEVVPWAHFLGRWVRVLNDLGGFTPGQRSSAVNSGIGILGVNICYEAIFPDLVRQSVLNGAVAIVNMTNDGWYMRTAAPYQHFIPNVFRAIENDRWVLRADNTGITAIIDPTGLVQTSSPIFVPTVITGKVAPRHGLTFYTRFGDVFAWGCLLFCILLSQRAILRRQ